MARGGLFRLTAITLCLLTVGSGVADVLDTENEFECDAEMPGCEEAMETGGGDSDTDRDWVFESYDTDSMNATYTYLSANDGGVIECFDNGKQGAGSVVMQVRYTCNEEFSYSVPDPKIALLSTGDQPEGPCGETLTCPAGHGVVTIFGSWSGSIAASVYQDGLFVDTAEFTLAGDSYGAVKLDIATDRVDDYTLELSLYDSTDTLVDQARDEVNVTPQEDQYEIRAVEYTDPEDADAATWVFNAHATVNPGGEGCLQLLADDGSVIDEAATPDGTETFDLSLQGGTDKGIDHARVSPSNTCDGNWTSASAEKVPRGS